MFPKPDWMYDTCWYCGERGHDEKDCPKKAREIRDGWKRYEEEHKRREDRRESQWKP